MSDVSQGPGWWLASDGKWYPPHTAPQATLPPDAGAAYPAYGAGAPTSAPADPRDPTGQYQGVPGQYQAPSARYPDQQTGGPAAQVSYQSPAAVPATDVGAGVGGPTAAPNPGAGPVRAPMPGAVWSGGPSGDRRSGGTPVDPNGVAGPATRGHGTAETSAPVPRRHWQPWLAVAGIALVLWGAGQGLVAWSEWHLVQSEFSPYGTVTQGHLGMALTAAGAVIAGLATVAIALVLDRR